MTKKIVKRTDTNNETLYFYTHSDAVDVGEGSSTKSLTEVIDDTLHKSAQTLTNAEKTQVHANLGTESFVGDRAVRYDEAQVLGSSEKTQALTNLGLNGVDEVPTENSNNVVRSGGVKAAIDDFTNRGFIYKGIAPVSAPLGEDKTFYIAKSGDYSAYTGIGNDGSFTLNGIAVLTYATATTSGAWTKNDIVLFDEEPTAGSDNLVKSGGVEKLLAHSTISNDNPEYSDGSMNVSGTVNPSSSQYGYYAPIELKNGETIFLNKGDAFYHGYNISCLFETDSNGAFVRNIISGSGTKKEQYTNSTGSTMYVGVCAYKNALAYKITSLSEAASKSDLIDEIDRATNAESKMLAVDRSQAFSDNEKAQALNNLGITGIDSEPKKDSTKIVQSGGVFGAIRESSKILTLHGNNKTFVSNEPLTDGFIPGHRYRFSIINFSEWTLPKLVANNICFRIYAFNNKNGLFGSENNFRRNVSADYYYNCYINNPDRNFLKQFDYVFPTYINKTITVDEEEQEVSIPIESWYARIEGYGNVGTTLKVLAEDVTDIYETKKEQTLNTSEDEWIEMDADFSMQCLELNTSTNVVKTASYYKRLWCYKAKAGDDIKFHIASIAGETNYFGSGIWTCKSMPRVGEKGDILVSTSSISVVNSSTVHIEEDCYVCLTWSGTICKFIVKNRNGLARRIKVNEDSIVNINERIDTQAIGDGGVRDFCAYLDKKQILAENRGYYFDDTFEDETSYIESSYLDRKISEVPNGKHFIFLTDSHIDYFSYIGKLQNETSIVKYVRDRMDIKNVIFGGDCIGVQNTKFKAAKVLSIYAKEKFEAFGSDFLFVMGNHDKNPFQPHDEPLEDVLISDVEAYNRTTKFMYDYGKAVFPTKLLSIIDESDELVDNAGNIMTQAEKDEFKAWVMLNYYYDDERQKIRYIVLETGDCGHTMRDIFGVKGDSQNSLMTIAYFIVDALKTIPNGYDVVVVGHWFINAGAFWTKVIYKVLAAYKNKQSVSVNFTPNTYNHPAVQPIVLKTLDNPTSLDNITIDFTENAGTGRIFCLSGHMHYDRAEIRRYVSDSEHAYVEAFPLTTALEAQTKDYLAGDILCIVCDRCNAGERGSHGIIGGSNYTEGAYSYPNDSSVTPVAEGGVERLGTVKEVLFDVVTITPDNRVVLTRFGAEGTDNGLPYIRNYMLPIINQ